MPVVSEVPMQFIPRELRIGLQHQINGPAYKYPASLPTEYLTPQFGVTVLGPKRKGVFAFSHPLLLKQLSTQVISP